MSAHAFPLLLSPIDLGDTTLPTPLAMGSIATGLEAPARHLPELAAYFAEPARGGVALSVTGGYPPNWHAWLAPAASLLASRRLADKHRLVTDAVHEHGCKIALQVSHAGRYAFHPFQRR